MSSPRAIEMYYTVTEVAVLLRLDERTIRRKIAAGLFSPGGDLSNIVHLPDGKRVPASGVHFFLDNHRCDPTTIAPIKARSMGELRRKAGRFSRVQTFGRKGANE